MNKFVWVFLAVMYNISNALIYCDNIDPYINEGFNRDEVVLAIKSDRKAHFANECYIEGGLGADYGYDGGWVPNCGNMTGSKNGYVKSKVSCDFCSANWVKQELKDIEDVCREDCRTSNYTCIPADIADLWGGEIKKINRSGGSCGAKLPGCAESSSSVGEDEQSSSSETPASSEAESSSSEEDELESSSSDEIGSSSSDDEELSSSSEDDNEEKSSSSLGDIIPCYKRNREGGCSLHTYASRYPMPLVGTLKFLPSGPDDFFFARFSGGEGYIQFNSNVPVQKRGYYYECYYDESNCGQGDEKPPMIDGDVLYFCVWGEPTSMGCATTSFSVGIEITENLKYRRSDVSPPNITDEQVLEMANEAARTYSEIDVSCTVNGVEKRYGTKYLGKNENRTIEDVFGYVKPYFDYCRSLTRSSSSRLSSSSSSEKSSSSSLINSSSSKTTEVSSSSLEKKSSSSVNNERSSSSKLVESSSSKQMSSSSEGDAFVAGADQEYTPGKIYSSGLLNMEPGKCYSLNPERGTQYGWICTNAQDSWWWHEVPCDGSAPVKKVTSAGCIENKRGSNAVYRPEDCFYSGLDNMEEGKCYSLNPARGTQHGWISTNAQDSWWWIETPCEKNDKGLHKRAFDSANGESDVVLEASQTTRAYYNALGRKMGRNKTLGVKQPVYSKKIRK